MANQTNQTKGKAKKTSVPKEDKELLVKNDVTFVEGEASNNASSLENKEVALSSSGAATLKSKELSFETKDASANESLLHLSGKRKLVQLPQWATAWLVLVPALIFIVLFMFYPIINTFFMAFIEDFRWVRGGGSFALGNFISAVLNPSSSISTPSFGFANFIEVLSDSTFLTSLGNTAILVVIEVPLTIIIALLLATALNSIKILRGFYQTVFFLPYVTNTIALGLIFNMIFKSGSGGFFNIILGWFGFEPISWVEYGSNVGSASKLASGFVIVVYSIWNGLAFKILVFMSGLATIDKQYYDAAKIDGSSRLTIWRRITLPLLSPQILYITITSFIGAFKMYTGVRAVFLSSNTYYFGGVDGTQWMPVVGWIYRELYLNSSLTPGIAAAGSVILLIIILLITIVQFAVSKKRVHY